MGKSDSVADLAKELFTAPKAPHEMAALADKWLSDDVTLHYPGAAPIPFAGVWRGKKGFADFIRTFYGQVEVTEMPSTSFASDGNRAFIEGRTTGKVLATGKTYTSSWLLIWTFENRKLTRMVEYHDTQAIANAFR